MKRFAVHMVIVSLLLVGCYSYQQTSDAKARGEAQRKQVQETINSWVSSHKSELIKEWGPPLETVSDGKDGEILIWEDKKIVNFISQGYSRLVIVTYIIQMYSDSNGKLYYGRFKTKL